MIRTMNTNASVGAKPSVNVDVPERIASVLAGSWFLLNGIRKGSLIRMGLGGWMVYRGATGHCPLYSAAGKPHLPDPVKNVNIRTTVQVNRPRHEVYSFWRKLENLPLFMKHLKQVRQTDERNSHWEAHIPGGMGTLAWDAVIAEEQEGRLIGWNSLPGATVENAGKVEFREIGDGWTELHVVITYRAPLGAAGQGLSSLLNPLFEKMVLDDIKAFKKYIEAGGTDAAATARNLTVS